MSQRHPAPNGLVCGRLRRRPRCESRARNAVTGNLSRVHLDSISSLMPECLIGEPAPGSPRPGAVLCRVGVRAVPVGPWCCVCGPPTGRRAWPDRAGTNDAEARAAAPYLRAGHCRVSRGSPGPGQPQRGQRWNEIDRKSAQHCGKG